MLCNLPRSLVSEHHRDIDGLFDDSLFGSAQMTRPAFFRRHSEYVLRFIFVLVFGTGGGVFAYALDKVGMALTESVSSVGQEDQAEHLALASGVVGGISQRRQRKRSSRQSKELA